MAAALPTACCKSMTPPGAPPLLAASATAVPLNLWQSCQARKRVALGCLPPPAGP